MNRNDFKNWGLELSSDEFSMALAALGVVRSETRNGDAFLPDILRRVISHIEADRPLAWHLEIKEISDINETGDSARALLDFWIAIRNKYGEDLEKLDYLSNKNLVRIGIVPGNASGTGNIADLSWVVSELSKPVVRASSVFISSKDTTHNVVWDYPLRIAFLGDPQSKQLMADIRDLKFHDRPLAGTHVEIVEIEEGRSDCDILLIPDDLRAAAIALIESPSALNADCVVISGRTDETDERLAALVESIRTQARANGVCLLPVLPSKDQPDRRRVWFKELIRELSHNLPIDVALFRSSRNSEVDAEPPLLFASKDLIGSSRISRRIEQFREQITDPYVKNMRSGTVYRGGDFRIEDRLERINERFRGGFEKLSWEHEGDTATDFSDAKSAAMQDLESVPPLPPKTRRIQAELWEYEQGVRKSNVADTPGLRQNTTCAIEVFIGQKSRTSTSADKEFSADLPPGKNEHELIIIFTEPNVSPEPKISKITLPREGDSSHCEFFIRIPAEITAIRARIIIAYKNRILQSALLIAPVLGENENSSDKAIELLVESAPRPGLMELTERTWFDSAFLLNHDNSGKSQLTKIVGEHAEMVAIEGISERIKWFDKKISSVAEEWEKFGALDSDKSVNLLRSCALNGAAIYKAIMAGRKEGMLQGTGDIQLVTAKYGSRFPLEFVYDRAAPAEKARLCPRAKESLQKGSCLNSCPKNKDDETIICPFGFWGLKRVIERQAYDPDAIKQMQNADFALQSEPIAGRTRLNILGAAVTAFSNNVDESDLEASKKVLNTLDTATGNHTKRVASWDEWKADIKDRSPSLLVLLPHTLKDPDVGEMMLEISAKERLIFARLKREHVLGPSGNPPPVVILMGCKTSVPDVPYESFVLEFRSLGAAIVVGTGATILGRHASTVTRAFIDSIKEAGSAAGPRSFGSLMLQIRRKMVADGILMALCLTSYGDTDWVV